MASLARTGQPTTSYAYNGLGTRVSKATSNGSRVYKRDGAHVTASVLSDSVSTMVPGITERSGGTTRHQLADYLGSVTDSMEYDAFGAAVSQTGTTNTQAGFAGGWGYQTDAESEYQLLGHRYYDPATGRFLTRDPIRDGRNWYGYCDNNPLTASDPSGLVLPNRAMEAVELAELGMVPKLSTGLLAFRAVLVSLGLLAAIDEKTRPKRRRKGRKLYRAFGGESRPQGKYWSEDDPRTTPEYRRRAGLPKENTMEYVAIGNQREHAVVASDGIARNLDRSFIPDGVHEVEFSDRGSVTISEVDEIPERLRFMRQRGYAERLSLQ